jgi:hypothetical protein
MQIETKPNGYSEPFTEYSLQGLRISDLRGTVSFLRPLRSKSAKMPSTPEAVKVSSLRFDPLARRLRRP